MSARPCKVSVHGGVEKSGKNVNTYRMISNRLSCAKSGPITSTLMLEPRHNILSNFLADIRKYVVTWLKHLRESIRPVAGPTFIPYCQGHCTADVTL